MAKIKETKAEKILVVTEIRNETNGTITQGNSYEVCESEAQAMVAAKTHWITGEVLPPKKGEVINIIVEAKISEEPISADVVVAEE